MAYESSLPDAVLRKRGGGGETPLPAVEEGDEGVCLSSDVPFRCRTTGAASVSSGEGDSVISPMPSTPGDPRARRQRLPESRRQTREPGEARDPQGRGTKEQRADVTLAGRLSDQVESGRPQPGPPPAAVGTRDQLLGETLSGALGDVEAFIYTPQLCQWCFGKKEGVRAGGRGGEARASLRAPH